MTNQHYENVIKAGELYISAEEFFGEEKARERKDRLAAKDNTRKLYYYKPVTQSNHDS